MKRADTTKHQARRDARGRWLPGQSANPSGLPGGAPGGRRLALRELDKMLAAAGNLKRLQKALQGAFDRDPLDFFRRYVMPLLPREDRVELDVTEREPAVRIYLPERGNGDDA